MIIVSQDKKTLVNFNNIAHLFIPEEGSFSNGKYKICYGNLAGSRSDLGEYKTEERTKEVLQEIINKYLEYGSIQDGLNNVKNVIVLPRVYEMPKE